MMVNVIKFLEEEMSNNYLKCRKCGKYLSYSKDDNQYWCDYCDED